MIQCWLCTVGRLQWIRSQLYWQCNNCDYQSEHVSLSVQANARNSDRE